MPGVPHEQGATVVPADAPPPTGPRSNLCEITRARLLWDFNSVRGCTDDAQCAYFDGLNGAVDRADRNQSITTSVCGNESPMLIVANAEQANSSLPAMRQDQQAQVAACAEPADPESSLYPCDSRTSFVSSAPPVCVRGACQVAPALRLPPLPQSG